MNKEEDILIPMIIIPNKSTNLQYEPELDYLDSYYDCEGGCDYSCDCDGGGRW